MYTVFKFGEIQNGGMTKRMKSRDKNPCNTEKSVTYGRISFVSDIGWEIPSETKLLKSIKPVIGGDVRSN